MLLLLSALDLSDNGGQELGVVHNCAVVGYLKQVCAIICVDGHDLLRLLHADYILNGTRDTEVYDELGLYGSAALADLQAARRR